MADRENLIELLGEALFSINWDFGDYPNTDEFADYLIANGVTVQQWIPVEERLPKNGDRVLCSYYGVLEQITRIVNFSDCLEDVDKYEFFEAKRSGFYGYDSEYGYYEINDVTHWMPIPEPPKGE